MKPNFLKSSQKKKLLAELEEFYGITKLHSLLHETGKQKIRGFSGHLSKDEIFLLGKTVNIEIVGMYLLSKKDFIPRINFDAVSIPEIKSQITKNIIEINTEQLNEWLHGQDIQLKTNQEIAVLKHNNDFVGVGKSSAEKIFNYIPKERKLKTPLMKRLC